MKHKLMLPLLAVLLVFGMSGQAQATEYSGGAFSGMLLSGDKLLATDVFNKVIWCLTSEGKTIYAGKSGMPDLSGEPTAGYYDGDLLSSRFASPWAIAPFL